MYTSVSLVLVGKMLFSLYHLGNQDIAALLIEAGCNFEFHDNNNKSPFEDAVMKKQSKVNEM